jgi:hypothetical protein
MDKKKGKGSVRKVYIVRCEQHGKDLPDENGNKYHGSQTKAERVGVDHIFEAKHITLSSKRVRIKRTVTVEIAEELKG